MTDMTDESRGTDWAKWQHMENVLVGYRAYVGREGYDPPAAPGSAREVSYRAGWWVACFDVGAAELRDAGLHSRVRGGEHTEGLEVIGGTGYEPEVCEGIGMFTGVPFLICFEGPDLLARVAVPGQHSTEQREVIHLPGQLPWAMKSAVHFVVRELADRTKQQGEPSEGWQPGRGPSDMGVCARCGHRGFIWSLPDSETMVCEGCWS